MAVAGRDFWSQFLNILEEGRPEQSDPGYYLPNQGGGAQSGEYANVIRVIFQRTQPGSTQRKQLVELLDQAGFWTATDDRDFWINQEVNELDIQDLEAAAEERMPNMFDASGQSVNVGAGGSGSPVAGAAPDVSPGPGAAGAAGQLPGVMPGGELVRVTRQGQDDLWALRYTVPGAQHVYVFDSPEQMTAALGPDAITSGRIPFGGDIAETRLNAPGSNVFNMGSAAPLVGQAGSSYQGFFNDIGQEAALKAGLRDPGKLGEYLRDPEIQRIMAEATQGGWTPQQTQAEIRNSRYYREELYPGIDRYIEAGIPDPEGAWWNYYNNVEGSLDALGVERDDDGSYRSSIARLQKGGVQDSTFTEFAGYYKRAVDNPELATTLDFWLDREAGRNVNFDDIFDVMAGTATGDLAQATENAIVQYQAEQRFSSTLSPEQIADLAKRTELSEQQVAQAFTSSEEALLALGDVGLRRYGLEVDQLVSSAFGLETEGGLSPVEVQRRIRKTTQELGLADDPKAQFFTSFDRFSRPVREGLAAAAPEVG